MIKYFKKIYADLAVVFIAVSAGFCAAMLCAPAHAGLATVGAVHDYVREKWGVEVLRNHADSNLISMAYLMQLVDAANEKLNGFVSSDYEIDGNYVPAQLVGASVGKEAADTLIEKVEWKFFFTPAATTNTYSFSISAAGHFYIDWGDGEKEFICKRDVNARTISHTYPAGTAANTYEIKLGGHATKYTTAITGAISFDNDASRLSAIAGCLGCVFSTIDDETVPTNARQPRFCNTFYASEKLAGEIPENLFDGVHGAPVKSMFRCTFCGCSGLTGSIPEKLFSGIVGAPANDMFGATFSGCSGLTGDIPSGLFAGIKGAPVEWMFDSTFRNCQNITSVAEDLFQGIDPTGSSKAYMFLQTFQYCYKLTGYSPKIGGKYLYEIWSNGGSYTFSGATNLSDYACIPKGWGGGGTKQPGECEPVAEEEED